MSQNARYLRIHGAFEVNNFGDILLSRIFADWARQAGWEPQIVDAPRYVTEELQLHDSGAEAPKALLMVGGGYLGEPNRRTLIGRWRWGFKMIDRHLTVLDGAQLKNIPCAVIGVGLGPISNRFARQRATLLLNRAQLCVLRDNESAEFAAEYGIELDAVSADAAITLSQTPLSDAAESERARIQSLADGRRIVTIQLDELPSKGTAWRVLFESLKARLSGKGCFLVGVSDQAGTRIATRHRQAAELLLGEFPYSIFEPYKCVDSLLGLLSASDLVITNKLHIGIVSSAYGRSVLSLPTHQKTIRFYRQIGRPEICLPKRHWSPTSIADAFEYAYQSVNKCQPIGPDLVTASLSNRIHVHNFLNSIT